MVGRGESLSPGITYGDVLPEIRDSFGYRYPFISDPSSSNVGDPGFETGGSFVVMPRHMQYKDRCIYIGDFSVAAQEGWVLNGIEETLHEYQHFTAKQATGQRGSVMWR
jgi:hypothetical protein